MDQVNSAPSRAPLAKLAGLVALVAVGAILAATTPVGEFLSRDGIGTAVEWLRGSPWAPLVYMVVYAAATALAVPGSVLTLAGGAVFGLFWGTLYTTVGANVGANLAFWVSRSMGRDGVKRLVGSRLDRLDGAARVHGFRALLTLRLIPAVPFNALNFGAGLTSVSWASYASATLIGILPGTIVYTMFADALLAGSQEASRDALIRVLISGALLVFLSFLPALARRLGIKVPGGAPAAAGVGTMILMGAVSPLGAQQLPTHEAFTEVLAEVVQMPLVDYEGLAAHREGLDAYLATLAEVDESALAQAPVNARLAFWINAYNACMIRQVVDNYPIQKNRGFLDRIRNAVTDRPDNSVWQIDDVFKRSHCRIAGQERSQDQIEHEMIRPMGDARIHFAVNCAARSCPPLWPEAYTAQAVDEQLDRAVRNLLGSPTHFAVEREGDPTVRLNKVLDWYKDDFGGIDGLRTFLAPFLSSDDAEFLQDQSTRVDFFDYDWTLNDIEHR